MKIIKTICSVCFKEFEKKEYEYFRTIELGRQHCCSELCVNKLRSTSLTVLCANCNKSIVKVPSQIKRSKSGLHFCSHTCSAKYNNTHKTTGIRRSKLESFIEQIIKETFPKIEIKCNSKTEIGSELDFYFPSFKLGIELNGPLHYEPIYGSDKLTQIQNNDQAKLRACDEKGIDLIIIPNVYKHFNNTVKSEIKEKIINIIQRRQDLNP